jgi:hypothetical protein
VNRALAYFGFACFCGLASAQQNAPAGSTVIYKHTDENGRVTYANSPIKGGMRVELEPITVIPSTPSGSLLQQNGSSPPGAPVPGRPVATPTAPVSGTNIPVARVVAVGARPQTEKTTGKAAPADANEEPVAYASRTIAHSAPTWPAFSEASAAAPQMTASLNTETLNRLSDQRRQETRKRLLEEELQSEEQLLADARQTLADEQRQSKVFRAMRATFVASSEAGFTPPTKDQRAEIERHFERVRNLQDQVSMHESQLKQLKAQLGALK